MELISTINPYNNKTIKVFDAHTPEQISQIITKANVAQRTWKNLSIENRATFLLRLASVLRLRKEELAMLAALEMGKILRESISEIEKCAWTCEFLAEKADEWLENQDVNTEARKSYVAFEPVGIVLAIMPWNYPFWQTIRCIVPALIAGNAAILKHAPNVPQCALAIASIFEQAGFPDGLFSTALLPNNRVNELITSDLVRVITFTGSTRAGSIVASEAGKYLKKTILELGGSDAFIVLADADIEHTAKQAAKARFTNAGQSCISPKRFIVEKAIYDPFVAALHSEISRLKMGNPTDSQSDYGPMAREDLAQSLESQVNISIKNGAKLICGGQRPNQEGAWFAATLLGNVSAGMPAYEEEMFGPVASVIEAKNSEDALTIANSTQYGLGASVWTTDLDLGEKIAQKLEAGNVFLNDIVRSDPRMPFGGIKNSGYGRELSHFGLREFVNIKSVWLK